MAVWRVLAVVLLVSCSNTSTNPGGQSGAAGAGGTGAAGAPAGGAGSSAGGTNAAGAGGITASGGAAGAGGITASGGAAGAGGITASGGAAGAGGITASGGSGGCAFSDVPTGICADPDPTGACGGPMDNCCVGDQLYLCPCLGKHEWSLPAPSGDCCPSNGTSISPNTACTTAPGVICCYSKTAYNCVNGSWQQYQGAFTCGP